MAESRRRRSHDDLQHVSGRALESQLPSQATTTERWSASTRRSPTRASATAGRRRSSICFGCSSKTSASTAFAAAIKRKLTGLKIAPFYGCYILRPEESLGLARAPGAQDLPRAADRAARRGARRVSRLDEVLRLPDAHVQSRQVARDGRQPHHRSQGEGRRSARDAVSALPSQPRRTAARRGARARSKTSTCRSSICRSSWAWRSASHPTELRLNHHVVPTAGALEKVELKV